jgi:hypothetical protein
MKQLRLFGAETQLERLSKLGDPLEKAKKCRTRTQSGTLKRR